MVLNGKTILFYEKKVQKS